VTFVLTYPVAEGLARAASRPAAHDRMEAMGEPFHERVAAAFDTFTTSAWLRAHPECGPIVKVDARQSEEAVAATVMATLGTRWPGTFSGLLASDSR
jgi:thymidylate kinase